MPIFVAHENKQKPLRKFHSNVTDIQIEYVQTSSALLRNTMTDQVIWNLLSRSRLSTVTQIGRLLGCFNDAFLTAKIYIYIYVYIGAVTSTPTSYYGSLGFDSRFRDWLPLCPQLLNKSCGVYTKINHDHLLHIFLQFIGHNHLGKWYYLSQAFDSQPLPPQVSLLWRRGGACVVMWSRELCRR